MTPKQLTGHEGLVDSVRIKTDLVVSSGADRQIRLWSTWSGECCRVIKVQFGGQFEGCFPMVDISGHRLVAVSFDVAYILDLQGRKADYPIQQFKASERITGIHLNSSTLKFSCCKTVHVYDFWDAS